MEKHRFIPLESGKGTECLDWLFSGLWKGIYIYARVTDLSYWTCSLEMVWNLLERSCSGLEKVWKNRFMLIEPRKGMEF